MDFENSFFTEMRLVSRGLDKSRDQTVYSIVMYEIGEEDQQIKYKKKIKVDGRLEKFKDKNSVQNKPFKQKFLYSGQRGEVFWFSVKQGQDKELMKLNILRPDESDTIEQFDVPTGSVLFDYITKGNDYNEKSLGGGHSGPNCVPQLITDYTGEWLLVITQFQWK